MAKMLIKNGEFKGEYWRLEGDKLVNGFYKVKELPLTELNSLYKREYPNSLYSVEFKFSNGIHFTATMAPDLYDELDVVYNECKNPRPLEESAMNRNVNHAAEYQKQESWKNGKVVAQRSEQNILQVLGWVIFAAIFFYGVKTSDLNRRDTIAYQKACTESVHAVTGYDRSQLIAEDHTISYQNDIGDSFIFRCTENKIQFYAEGTGQWINMRL